LVQWQAPERGVVERNVDDVKTLGVVKEQALTLPQAGLPFRKNE